jgi:uncharacterized protein with ParB-like and HNH nuclease domain
MGEIKGEKKSLSQLFSEEFFFNIPEYQRPYSWKTDHCEQLFDDIYESNRDNEYFLGTIILQETGNIGKGKKYDIIDGQQRLTTLQILLACLRDNISDKQFNDPIQKKILQEKNLAEGIPERYRLEVRDKEFFKKYIQLPGSTKNELPPENQQSDACANIINAINVFGSKLKELSEDSIKHLIQHILQRCILIYVSTSNFNDAFRLFTIVNDRGLQLRRIDILKSQNIEPSVIHNEGDRKEFAKKWEQMEDDLGSDEFEKLIFYLRSILVKEKAKDDILTEYNNLIFDKNKLNKGKDFINYLYDYKKLYQRLFLDKSVFPNTDTRKTKFNNLIHIMNDYLPSGEWVSPLLYYFKKFNTDQLYEFLVKFEYKFVFDWLNGLSPTKRITNINSLLKEIEKASNPNLLLTSDIFDVDSNKLAEILSDKDFYHKPYCKYVLVKLEYLSSDHDVEKKYNAVSIEHVLPRNPKKNSEWLKIFEEKQIEQWTNNIANLILLSKRKNSAASNKDFKDKKEKYFNDRISELPRSISIFDYDKWTPDILSKRHSDVIDKYKMN